MRMFLSVCFFLLLMLSRQGGICTNSLCLRHIHYSDAEPNSQSSKYSNAETNTSSSKYSNSQSRNLQIPICCKSIFSKQTGPRCYHQIFLVASWFLNSLSAKKMECISQNRDLRLDYLWRIISPFSPLYWLSPQSLQLVLKSKNVTNKCKCMPNVSLTKMHVIGQNV